METFLQMASSYAGDIDFLIILIAVLGGFWLFLAEGIIFWLCFKFRRSANPRAQYITGDQKHEKKWISIPHWLVLVCDVFIIFFAIKVWYHVKQELPEAEQTVRITGHQWAWRFQHPGLDGQLDTADDVETIDELRVIVGKTYHFKLESADVLHSFSVPVFRLKQDAVPGREITGWFKPTKTGEFDVQCTEICGIGHGIMGARIKVESEEEHRNWLNTKAGKNS
jgi:cytochrome c oxidase subunit 2